MVNYKIKIYLSFWVQKQIFYVIYGLQKLFHNVRFGIK